MQFTFESPTYFENGQAVSAYDLNKYTQNNALIRKILYSPQQLPMDSNVYVPKSVPLGSASPPILEQTLWDGSFLYRSGMQKAYLGMAISLESALTNGSMPSFNAFPNLALVVSIGYTNKSYAELKASTQYNNYYAGVPLASGLNNTVTVSGIVFNIKDANNLSAISTVVPTSGTTWETINTSLRITTVEIDLINNRSFTDGEIVSVRVFTVANLSDVTKQLNTVVTKSVSVDLFPYLKHTMLYAEVDGDLSYSKNWADIPAFVSTGSDVLNKDNLNTLSDKQQYLIERLSNRPSILTGSVFYFATLAATKSHRYINADQTCDVAETYNEQVSGPYQIGNIIRHNFTQNAESSLGTFAWNPFLDVYNQIVVSYKVYCNTDTKSAFIVEIPNGPTPQKNMRFTDGSVPGFVGIPTTNNLTGDAKIPKTNPVEIVSEGFSNMSSVSYNANYKTIATQSAAGSSSKFTNLYPFQVRIPSLSTPSFKKELGFYDADFYFTKGFYEDSTAITFESSQTLGNYKKWGLAKSFDETTSGYYTSQIGFVAEAPKSIVPVIGNNTSQYNQLLGYNSTVAGTKQWKWISAISGLAGYRPVYINYYDFTPIKANYISAVHLIDVCAFNSSNINYGVNLNKYSAETPMTYSGLVSDLKIISDEIEKHKVDLFDINPHFNRHQMFWKSPQGFTQNMSILKEHIKKFFYFTKKRVGDLLIVRGSNVTLYYGPIEEIDRASNPNGTYISPSDLTVKFEKSQSIISGDTEQTVIFNLNNAEGLFYGEQYYLQGTVIYAAEFFEEPS